MIYLLLVALFALAVVGSSFVLGRFVRFGMYGRTGSIPCPTCGEEMDENSCGYECPACGAWIEKGGAERK